MQACEVVCLIVHFCLASPAEVQIFLMYVDKTNSVEMAFQGPTVHSASVLDCALMCTQIMSYCHSFFYNELNGQCTPGSWLHPSLSPMDDRLGDLYFNQDYVCNGADGFQYIQGSNDNEKACVFVSSYTATHAEAKNYCQAFGGQLYVSDLFWKTILLNYNVLYGALNETFWVTINDVGEEKSPQRCAYLSIMSDRNVWTPLDPCQLDIVFKFVCELN